MAVAIAGVRVELREVLLRDKAALFLETSPSATVPCLKVGSVVMDESFDIMMWALGQNDPNGWLDMPNVGFELIKEADGPFKQALDSTKYHTRYPDLSPDMSRKKAMDFLVRLDAQIDCQSWLFGDKPSIADMAILPFVRQFAFIDKPRFDVDAGASTRRWLETFLASGLFSDIMPKLPIWQEGDPVTLLDHQIVWPSGQAQPAPQ